MVSIICNAVIVLLAFGAVANAIVWVPCSGTQTKGTANKVIVAGCETTPTCSLKKGVNASIEIDFTIDEDSTSAKSVVHGIIEHIPVPFAPDNPDVCKDSSVQCPLKKGQSYTYKTNIFVKTIYPDIKLKVRWEIQDDNGDDVLCVELPAKIDGSNNTPKTSGSRNKPLIFNARQQL
jgi:Niemann-Pick C2 protein